MLLLLSSAPSVDPTTVGAWSALIAAIGTIFTGIAAITAIMIAWRARRKLDRQSEQLGEVHDLVNSQYAELKLRIRRRDALLTAGLGLSLLALGQIARLTSQRDISRAENR